MGRHAAETGLNVLPDMINHQLLGLVHGAGLGAAVQLLALDGQHRLQTEHGPDGRYGRGQTAAFFQVF